MIVVSALLATAVASCAPALSAQRRAVPDIWGVWMGLGGVAGADPRFRNTPFPADPDFTEWGAEESRRLASPITPASAIRGRRWG